jgi:hypothetical protein
MPSLTLRANMVSDRGQYQSLIRRLFWPRHLRNLSRFLDFSADFSWCHGTESPVVREIR